MRDVVNNTSQNSSVITRKSDGAVISNQVFTHHSHTKFRYDITPGFRRADGLRYPTTYAVSDTRVTPQSFDCEITNAFGSKFRWTGLASTSQSGERFDRWNCTQATVPLCTVSNNLANRVDTLIRLRLGRGSFDAGVALAEIGKTAGFVLGSSITLLRVVQTLRRGDILGFFAALGIKPKTWRRDSQRSAADVWLKYQYAVRPLVNDVYDGYSLIQNGLKSFPPMTVKASLEETNLTPSSFSKKAGERMEGTSVVGREVKVWYSVESSWLAGLQQVGLINPLSIAWELVPYSFVVDWILPIGTFLKALSSTAGLQFVCGYRLNYGHVAATAYYVPNGYSYSSGKQASMVIHGTAMNRVALLSFPSAKPFVKPVNLSPAKLATLVALMQQRS